MLAVQTRNKIHLLALFSAVILLMVILYVGKVAEIVIVAALLAYILDPVVTLVEQRRLSRSTATTIIMLLITVLVVFFWYTVIPIAIAQFKTLQSGSGATPASQSIANLEIQISEILSFFGLGGINLAEEFNKLKSALVYRIPNFLIHDSPTLIIGLVMTPFVMFFLLKDARAFKKYFISMVPNRYFEFTLDLLYKMEDQLGNYLRGQFIDAIVFGLLATAALWALDVPYFVFIGIFSGLANLIPFVGPVAGASAAMIAVVLEQGDLIRGGYVLLAFIALKLIDDVVIQPLAVGKHVDLHPMVIALGILVGGHIFGILGMLLVIPFLGFLKVVMEESIQAFRRYRFD
jgi:putative permease